MFEDLGAVFQTCSHSARAIVITSVGGAFSSGINLAEDENAVRTDGPTYVGADGRQYVVIAAGGSGLFAPQ